MLILRRGDLQVARGRRERRPYVAVILLLASLAEAHIAIRQIQPLPLGTPAPNLNLKDLSGTRHTRESLHLDDGVVVLFFWSLFDQWSPDQLSRWTEFQRRYGPRSVSMLAINLDGRTDAFNAFIASASTHVPVAVDVGPDGTEINTGMDRILQTVVTFEGNKMKEQLIGLGITGQTQRAYGVGIIPSAVVVEKGRIVLYQGLGMDNGRYDPKEWKTILDRVESALPRRVRAGLAPARRSPRAP